MQGETFVNFILFESLPTQIQDFKFIFNPTLDDGGGARRAPYFFIAHI